MISPMLNQAQAEEEFWRGYEACKEKPVQVFRIYPHDFLRPQDLPVFKSGDIFEIVA